MAISSLPVRPTANTGSKNDPKSGKNRNSGRPTVSTLPVSEESSPCFLSVIYFAENVRGAKPEAV
jgi:hypothetical protein